MTRLRLAEISRLRSMPGRSLLLFITDRCPVGCGHCSVDSRRDSPRITDFALFESILEGICAQPELTTVVVTGGEPFVERRGLTMAVERVTSAEKNLVLFTSGVWATTKTPEWIRGVLGRASCVFLSTDAYHARAVGDDSFVRAARTIAAEGVWIVVQVLDIPEMVAKAESLLQDAFGSEYSEYGELNLTTPLPYGRGAGVFSARRTHHAGQFFGPCNLLSSRVVRYDGRVSACCNEQVIMGWGPERLRRSCASAEEVKQALTQFDADPLLKVMRTMGTGVLTHHPRFADLAQREFSSICQLCWAMQKRGLPLGDQSDRPLTALAILEPEATR